MRFCEACGAPVAEDSGASSSPPQAASNSKAGSAALARAPARPETSHGAGAGLRWAAPLALCSAAVAGWLWLQSREPDMPALPQPAPTTSEAASAAATSGQIESPAVVPAESADVELPATDPIAAEYQAIKARHERAYRAYTILITEGGSGNVIEARDQYAAAYEDLKRFQELHPEYAK